jgi:hypothetical protein
MVSGIVWISQRLWAIILSVVIIGAVCFGIYVGAWALTSHNAQHQQEISQQIDNGNAKFSVTGTAAQIENYNKYYTLYGNYQADLETVATNMQTLVQFQGQYTSAEIAADPSGNLGSVLQQDEASVTAAQQSCTRDATTYNNDSLEVKTGAEFKGVDLSKQVSVLACEKGNLNG